MSFIKCTLVTFTILLLSFMQKIYAVNAEGVVKSPMDSSMASPDPMSLILIGVGVLGIGLVGWWGRGN